MATATFTGNITDSSGKVTGTYTDRATYTATQYANRTVITLTKYEEKFSSSAAGGTISAGTFSYSYYDSNHSYKSANISYSAYECKTSYVTVWSGSKTITTYKSTSTTTIRLADQVTLSIPAADKYAISFAANGGSNPPSTVYKYYGFTLNLPSTRPTRTGYTFVDWLSSADSKHYNPYATYTLNQASTMTAQWTPVVKYIYYKKDADSVVGALTQKTYDVPETLNSGASFSKKSLLNGVTHEYELIEWNTASDGSGTSYELGGAAPNIVDNLYLYGIWNDKYIWPYLSNLSIIRTTETGTTETDKGLYFYITFDFLGCSQDGGTNYTVPSCTITIDNDEYTPTLTFTDGYSGSCAYKASTQYDLDNMHTVTVHLEDSTRSASNYQVMQTIATGIYPIDLYSNDTDREVYMGIMHPYVSGQLLTIQDLYTDGDSVIRLDVDDNASISQDAVDGADKELFNAIRNGQQTDCIVSSNNVLYLDNKKLITKLYNSEFNSLNNTIPANADLNTYTAYGRYRPANGAIQTIANRPTNYYFILTVDEGNTSSIRQTVTVTSSMLHATYVRVGSISSGGITWNPWYYSMGYIVGEIRLMARRYGGFGWSQCDGKALSRETYSELFTAIGTSYGSGDGSTTFNIPDLRGRVPICCTSYEEGAPSLPSGISARNIGAPGGSEDAIIPYHRHKRGGNWYKSGGTSGTAFKGTSSSTYTADAYTGYAEGSTSGNTKGANMQPFLTMIYYIYTGVINV